MCSRCHYGRRGQLGRHRLLLCPLADRLGRYLMGQGRRCHDLDVVSFSICTYIYIYISMYRAILRERCIHRCFGHCICDVYVDTCLAPVHHIEKCYTMLHVSLVLKGSVYICRYLCICGVSVLNILIKWGFIIFKSGFIIQMWVVVLIIQPGGRL